MQRLTQNATFLLCLTALFWGGNAVASQFAVGHISPMLLTFLRWLFGFGFLYAFFGTEISESWKKAKTHIRLMLLMAFLGFAGFNSIFYVAAETTTALNIGILQGCLPVVVAIGSFFFYKTRLTLLQIFGIIIAMLGAIIVACKGSLDTLISLKFVRGDLLMLLAIFLYAGYMLLLKKRPPLSPPIFMTLLAFLALLETVPLVIWEIASGNFIAPTVQGWIVACYVGFGVAAISQLSLIRATDLVGPVKAGVYVNLVPVIAAGLSIILLGEHFATYHAIALIFVMSGIYLAQKKH